MKNKILVIILMFLSLNTFAQKTINDVTADDKLFIYTIECDNVLNNLENAMKKIQDYFHLEGEPIVINDSSTELRTKGSFSIRSGVLVTDRRDQVKGVTYNIIVTVDEISYQIELKKFTLLKGRATKNVMKKINYAAKETIVRYANEIEETLKSK